MRNNRIFFGILLGLLILGVLAGATWYAYNVGIAEGVMQSTAMTLPPTDGTVPPSNAPYWYYRSIGFGRPFGFGFGFLGCLVPIFFILLLFALFRFAFRPRWGGGWRGGGMDGSDGNIPPRVQEWHRRLHEQEANSGPSPEQSR